MTLNEKNTESKIRMMQVNLPILKFSKSVGSKRNTKAGLSRRRWHRLCKRYLPVKSESSVWRYNRESKLQEPLQGWKLHISATVLEACSLFERVAPFLISQDVQFKAPDSLDELAKINSGLQYGYHQVGKFITVYTISENQAVNLARELHELTKEFVAITVPFDEQYLPESSVFYRYGAFASIKMMDKNGEQIMAIKNPAGELVPDNRFQAVPEWLKNPFQHTVINGKGSFQEVETPLRNTYKVFRATTQRGKGGTYHAVDLSQRTPRFCIVKEGRRYGEIGWNGQDGYYLVKNELKVLSNLGKKNKDVPRVFSSFEIGGDFYLVMEYVDGKSLHSLMKYRRRRFSIKQIIKYAFEISKIIENIHQAGWVWNDCKPSNLIVTTNKMLRPIDFEGAYPINKSAPFDWKTKGFSKSSKDSTKSSGKSEDIYALGAVVYFLLTGILYRAESPVEIAKLRSKTPKRLIEIIGKLLNESGLLIEEVRKEFEELHNLPSTQFKD